MMTHKLRLKLYLNDFTVFTQNCTQQSWILKSFSDTAADATADAANKIAIFN